MNEMKIKLSEDLIFKNKEMENIVYQAMKIAEVDSTVLISGESGVVKKLSVTLFSVTVFVAKALL